MDNVYGYTQSHDKKRVYSKEEIDNNFYSKNEANTNFYNKTDTYSKQEVNAKLPGSILSGTTEPTSALGVDGDIYIKYEE